MDKAKYNQKGFTLIEVLVAIAILSFGLIAMNFMQVQSVRGNAGAQRLTEKIWYVSDTIESLLAEDFGEIEDLHDNNSDSCTGEMDGIRRNLRGGYTVCWDVVDKKIDGELMGKDIRVIVYDSVDPSKKYFYNYYRANL